MRVVNRLHDTPIVFRVYSMRFYGQPKLAKPKELRGIKQAFSVDYIPRKCRCQVFVKGDDIWVKHRDYFSSLMTIPAGDLGTPLAYRAKKYLNKDISSKFIYDDSWGSIVLRNEAWLVIENLYKQIREERFPLDIIRDIREGQEMFHEFEFGDLMCTDMERMWERVIMELVKNKGEIKNEKR